MCVVAWVCAKGAFWDINDFAIVRWGTRGSGREGEEVIVVRRFVRTCLIVPAAHHILYRLLRIQRLLVFHYAKRGEAPVDRVHAQVRRHVVGQVILILRCIHSAERIFVRLEDNSTTYFP